MFDLLPTEYWAYTSLDLIRGLRTGLAHRAAGADSEIWISGLGPCLAVRSARTALVLALKALALPPDAGIGVPLYCCPIVFQAIRSAGYRPRFIDVDADTYCLSANDLSAKSSEVEAVVAVHMFGHVCNMPRLRDAAPGKAIIEDCAQALGSRLGDRLVGSLGDMSVFSFRSGKYISAGEGGALYCRSRELHAHVSEMIAALPKASRFDECSHVLATFLRSALRTRPLWGMLGARLWDMHTNKIRYTPQLPLTPRPVFDTDWTTVVRRLPLVDSCIKEQRAIADYYSRNLNVHADMICSETPSAFFNRLQYPLLMPSAGQRDGMAAMLRKDQISTTTPYKDIATIAAESYGYTGDCPVAEAIAQRVIVIPCNHGMKADDVRRVAACVNRAWVETGDRRSRGSEIHVVRPAVEAGGSASTEQSA